MTGVKWPVIGLNLVSALFRTFLHKIKYASWILQNINYIFVTLYVTVYRITCNEPDQFLMSAVSSVLCHVNVYRPHISPPPLSWPNLFLPPWGNLKPIPMCSTGTIAIPDCNYSFNSFTRYCILDSFAYSSLPTSCDSTPCNVLKWVIPWRKRYSVDVRRLGLPQLFKRKCY